MTRDHFIVILSGGILAIAALNAILTGDHFIALLAPPSAMLFMSVAWKRSHKSNPGFFLFVPAIAALIALMDGGWLAQPLTVNPDQFSGDVAPDKLDQANTLLNLTFRLGLTCLAIYSIYYTARSLVHSRKPGQENTTS